MDQIVINARSRNETGKAIVKSLRKEGRMPAVLYGITGAENKLLDVDEVEFEKVWKTTTKTTVISLNLDDGKQTQNVLIKDTQYDIIDDKNLHADFYAVDNSKPIRVRVGVKTTGNAAGVRAGGTFETGISSISIECLPQNLPERVVVDVSNLGIGQSIQVKDLPLGEGVKIMSDLNRMVAIVRAPK